MSAVIGMINNLVLNEQTERCSILAEEGFEAIELEINHMIGVEMFQRVLVHRLSRVAFRRLKRRARKSRASMARAAGRIPPLKINGMFAENDESESESDEGIPKIQIRKTKKSSISGESACHSDNSARSSNSALRVHSPYTYKGYCNTTQDATGAFVPNDSLNIGQHLTPDFDCEDCTDNEFLDVPQNDSATSPRTCDHHQSWKRLRHKRGISYFVCTTCNRRWRKMNTNATKEFECQQAFPQQMYAVPMTMPVPMYACAYPFACYYPTYTQ